MDAPIPRDLLAWVTRQDEAAFRRLVDHHQALVTAICRRQLGNGAAAEEAAQAVFIILARRAASVSNPQALEAWLYGVAWGVCRHARRAAARRRHHEQEAAMLQAGSREAQAATAAGWSDLRPQLDDAIASLGSTDRALVVSHFLHGMPQGVAAERLGISENAAQKRLANALGKLRTWFSRRGVSVGVGVLAAGLASEAAAGEPALATIYAQAALHPASAAGATALAGSVTTAGTVKLATIVLVAALACAGSAVAATHLMAPTPPTPPTVPAPRSAAAPMTASAPAPTTLLDYTLEDGLRPDRLMDGTVVPGPAREGNRFCLEGVTRPSGDTFKQEVVLAAPEAGLYRRAPGMRLSFDCWLSDGPGHLWVTSWDESQKGVLSLELPTTAHGAWTRVDLQVDDLRLESDATRAGASGDLMLNLIIKYFGDRDGHLYVDNLRLTKPADW